MTIEVFTTAKSGVEQDAPQAPTTMSVAVFEHYGTADQVEVRQRPVPVVGSGQLLLKTLATTVSAADSRIRSLTVPKGYGTIMRLMFGISRPRLAARVLGTEMVGEVVAIGEGVGESACGGTSAAASGYKVGDIVVAYSGSKLGCHSGYRLFDADAALIPKPAGLSVEEAAAMSFGGLTAMDFLINKGGLQAGQSVLVIGAAGAVGSAAVQIASHYGAKVTAVCSAANLELVKQLGAEQVIDYQQHDPLDGSQQYDLIFDAVGGRGIQSLEQSLADNGKALLVVADMPLQLRAAFYRGARNTRLIAGVASEQREALQQLGKLVADGGYRPVIGHRFGVGQIRQAHQLVDSGHKRGNCVVSFCQ